MVTNLEERHAGRKRGEGSEDKGSEAVAHRETGAQLYQTIITPQTIISYPKWIVRNVHKEPKTEICQQWKIHAVALIPSLITPLRRADVQLCTMLLPSGRIPICCRACRKKKKQGGKENAPVGQMSNKQPE